MQRQLKITTIFVTHDQQEALSLSDRVVVMNEGRIEQVGTPNEIYENPVSVFVADFIGSTNIIRGVVTHCDAAKGICEVRLPSSPTISIPCNEKVRTGEEINFIIKPEKVDLGRTPRVEHAVKGVISGASYLGSAFNYEIRIGDLKLEVLDTQVDYRNRYEIGDSIFLTFDPEGVKVLQK
jgi:ABC-type Fe3+/spermidine/putrescine transport system ATPase subunit